MDNWFATLHPTPICVGSGLVALDVVVNGNKDEAPKMWAGGSCGNVLVILSYLGWESHPVARLKDDFSANHLVRDMKRWRVKTDLLSLTRDGSTPIIVERIDTRMNGAPFHRFEWICPDCKSWLPQYKPVLAKDVEAISTKVPEAEVFYFDRVARSSVDLAKFYREKGGLVVFEPSSAKENKLFLECLELAHVVKYSHERLPEISRLTEEVDIPLEIETLGRHGLRYRFRGQGKTSRSWKSMNAFSVANLRDSAGSGDWCTAGLIHALHTLSKQRIAEANPRDIRDALMFGQALGALNCCYEGARGGMYAIARQEFEKLIGIILNGQRIENWDETRDNVQVSAIARFICPQCRSKNDSGGGLPQGQRVLSMRNCRVSIAIQASLLRRSARRRPKARLKNDAVRNRLLLWARERGRHDSE